MAFKEKKRILHITPFFPPDKGGISNLVKNLCKALENYDNEIHIMTSSRLDYKNDYRCQIRDNLIRIRSFFFPVWPYSTLRNFSIPLDLGFKVNKIIKNGNYDVIHVHGHHYPISWMAIKSAFKYKVPIVLSIHGMYALNPNVLGGKSMIEDLFNISIFKHILSKCTVVIGGTSQIAAYAKKYGKPDTKFSIVANGVNTINFLKNISAKREIRTIYNIAHNSIVILFVGRFEEVKSVIEFSKAARMLAEQDQKYEIIMVGEGKLLPNVIAITNGIKNIKILGWLTPDKIHEIYIASDIFVLPSKFEGLPLSLLEAMNANLYIIYTPLGGVKDILKEYHKKSMLSSTNPTEIRDTIIEVTSKQHFNIIDSASFEYAKTFDWIKIAKQIDDIYKEIRHY